MTKEEEDPRLPPLVVAFLSSFATMAAATVAVVMFTPRCSASATTSDTALSTLSVVVDGASVERLDLFLPTRNSPIESIRRFFRSLL